MVTREDLAWAAGLFEGEGTISARFNPSIRKGRKKRDRGLVLKVKMTDEDVLRTFHKIVGVGKFNGPYFASKRKPVWIWQTGAIDDIRYVISLILPWLHSRRKSRITELFEWYDSEVNLPFSKLKEKECPQI